MKADVKNVSVTSSTTIDVATVYSNFHIDINPSEAGFYDRQIVQHVIKDFTSNQSVAVQLASKVHEINLDSMEIDENPINLPT